jgi:hypothetical protein
MRRIRMSIWVAMLALAVAGVCHAASFQQPSTWTTPIPPGTQPIANSAQYIQDILINGKRLFVSYHEWSVPIWQATGSSPFVTVTCENPHSAEQGWNVVPIPKEAVPPGAEDNHMTILSADGQAAWDFYHANKVNQTTWTAKTVRRWDLHTDGINSPYDGLGGVRACPSPLLQGLIQKSEIEAGQINHALDFAYWAITDREERGQYPCEQYYSGLSSRQWAMSLGMRLQLDPTLDCQRLNLTTASKAICRALQVYGAILVDITGKGEADVYAESDVGKSWSWGNTFGDLRAIPLDRLRVVAPITIPVPKTSPPAVPNDVGIIGIH